MGLRAVDKTVDKLIVRHLTSDIKVGEFLLLAKVIL